MKKDSKQFFDTLLSAEASADTIRVAFKNFAMSVTESQSSFDKKKEKMKKDMEHGARRTSHKFRI